MLQNIEYPTHPKYAVFKSTKHTTQSGKWF